MRALLWWHHGTDRPFEKAGRDHVKSSEICRWPDFCYRWDLHRYEHLSADQYLSIVLPGQMFVEPYKDQKLKSINLSRTLEDSGTLTSALVPWNTCGAYMTGTLGVSTFAYAPFAFFNILCPIIAIIYGFSLIAVPSIDEEKA